jgi:hypothetical protein
MGSVICGYCDVEFPDRPALDAHQQAEAARDASERQVGVARLSAGHYETAAGHLIDFHSGTGWCITYPGERGPDVARSTLRECREYLAAAPE